MKYPLSLFLLTLFLTTSISHADDYVWGEEFEEGDIISAATFNQIFSTLQKLNRTIKDSDLVGTWSCDAYGYGSYDNRWITSGMIRKITNSQLTMTASSASTSLEAAYSYSTSNPPALYLHDDKIAYSGTYALVGNVLIFDGIQVGYHLYDIQLVSDDRFVLSPKGVGANHPIAIICDSAIAVPAAPTATTATNAQTLVNITWTDQSSDETGFKVYRRLSNEAEATELATAVTASPYSDSTLTEGQTAYYSVAAYNDNGESAKSKVANATLDSVKPTVASTSPTNGGSTTGTTVTINFSESIIIKCPTPSRTCGGLNPIKLVGAGNTYYMGLVDFSGSTLSSQPFVDGANPSYTVTIDSDFIYDLNGNKMSQDYVFTFTDN